jgi:hypothetical protein
MAEISATNYRNAAEPPGVKLFVGGHAGKIQGEREDLVGDRMFTAAYRPYPSSFDCSQLNALLDSGAFSDPWSKRLSPEQALERQLIWEHKASQLWSQHWQCFGLVSYDLLIDEVWTGTERQKQRWTVKQADHAVAVTVDAANYLADQRQRLWPRNLILSCQGVDAIQYRECVVDILKIATPDDWIGLGGWCILGRQISWMPEFFVTCYEVLPLISTAGIKHVHIFGVLYLPALGGLLWLCDQYNLVVSTDSTRPILQTTWKGDQNRRKANIQFPYWRDNVNWWKTTLAELRYSKWYKKPDKHLATRQLSLF